MGILWLWAADFVFFVLLGIGAVSIGLADCPRWARPLQNALDEWSSRRWYRRAAQRGVLGGQQLPFVVSHRTIQTVAADVRRLSAEFNSHSVGGSRVQAEATRRAYDAVLIEACTALDVVHLLEVLGPGPDLDTERTRVEAALIAHGLVR